jgi:uncharacterized protein YjiS (DUF1127 family)
MALRRPGYHLQMRKYNMTTLAIKIFQRGGVSAPFSGALTKALDLFAAYRQARRERAQLLALGDRELQDIGITRVDALNAAHQPLLSGLSVGGSWRHGAP